MSTVEVIENPAAAATALDPLRNRILAELREPASASSLAEKVELPRQRVNYYLRTLEAHGLAYVVETRRWGGLTERLLVAKAPAFIISPSTLGPIAVEATFKLDRLSASYLLALAGRVIREVGALIRGATAAKKHLATLSIDTEIRFRSAAERAAFTDELTQSINGLVAKYHDESAIGGRLHRLTILAHPLAEPTNADKE
jgi:DNA-binding transcriptional ArsR family regulator